jgi:glycosyltransferase involved in cell wall biosynthesis
MRILQLIMARQYRGAEIFASQLAVSLAGKGHSLLVVSLYDVPTAKFDPGVPFDDMNGKKSALLSLQLLAKLKRVCDTFNPDIIQANAGDTLKYAVALRILHRVRAKIVFRNASTISQYTGRGAKSRAIGFLFRRVDAVASVSEFSKSDITSLFPFLAKKTRVIPGGVKLSGKKSNDPLYEQLFESRPVFLHVGGYSFEKNHEGLLRIMSDYLATGGKGSLLLVGDGPLRPVVTSAILQSGMGANANVLGSRGDVGQLLRRADALVLPSIIEGLPTVILEAFAAGTLVIAYDVGGVPELVEDGITGWLVKKNDEKAFVRAMLEVEKLPAEKKQHLIEAAHKLISEKYDSDEVTARFESLYKSLLDQ